jgi:hypothetical protein
MQPPSDADGPKPHGTQPDLTIDANPSLSEPDDGQPDVAIDLNEPCPLCSSGEGMLRLVQRGYQQRVECTRRLAHVSPSLSVSWSPAPPDNGRFWEVVMMMTLFQHWGCISVKMAHVARGWHVDSAGQPGSPASAQAYVSAILARRLAAHGLLMAECGRASSAPTQDDTPRATPAPAGRVVSLESWKCARRAQAHAETPAAERA